MRAGRGPCLQPGRGNDRLYRRRGVRRNRGAAAAGRRDPGELGRTHRGDRHARPGADPARRHRDSARRQVGDPRTDRRPHPRRRLDAEPVRGLRRDECPRRGRPPADDHEPARPSTAGRSTGAAYVCLRRGDRRALPNTANGHVGRHPHRSQASYRPAHAARGHAGQDLHQDRPPPAASPDGRGAGAQPPGDGTPGEGGRGDGGASRREDARTHDRSGRGRFQQPRAILCRPQPLLPRLEPGGAQLVPAGLRHIRPHRAPTDRAGRANRAHPDSARDLGAPAGSPLHRAARPVGRARLDPGGLGRSRPGAARRNHRGRLPGFPTLAVRAGQVRPDVPPSRRHRRRRE